jgi:hypothetical protein
MELYALPFQRPAQPARRGGRKLSEFNASTIPVRTADQARDKVGGFTSQADRIFLVTIEVLICGRCEHPG